jgi:hypothetical protein
MQCDRARARAKREARSSKLEARPQATCARAQAA